MTLEFLKVVQAAGKAASSLTPSSGRAYPSHHTNELLSLTNNSL
jgi:hypothetical protein